MVMLRSFRRGTAGTGVQFCDGCAEVTTAQQRASRRYERVREQAQAFAWLR
jgi:hypothetical protein